MGTNFYWTRAVKFRKDDDPTVHIGKRSAAGLYCWDCGLTMCKLGTSRVHGNVVWHDGKRGPWRWHEECPECGQKPVEEGLDAGPAAVELGFTEPRKERPTGVRGCSSFTWAQESDRVREKCLKFHNRFLRVIVDEYGRKMTGREFGEMLDANCPIQFMDSIGERFS